MVSYVTYLRVSTQSQGRSGLGLEGQRAAVDGFLRGEKALKEFVEVESGKRADRPELAAAIAYAKKHKAVLLIAKLDRLARNVHFISGLMESKVSFKAVDMPEADEFTIHIFAAMAQREAKAISLRTKAALAAKKARGDVLGCQDYDERLTKGRALWSAQATARKANVSPIIAEIKAAGVSTLQGIANALNARGIKTARGGAWSATQVSRAM